MANTGDTLQFFTNLGSIIQKEKDVESNKKNGSQSFLDPFFDSGVNKKYMKYTKKQPKSYKIKGEDSDGSSEEQDSNEESNDGATDVSNTSGDFKRSDWDEDIEDRATKEEVEGQFDDMGSESSSDDDNSGNDDSDVSDEEDGDDDDGEGKHKKKKRRRDDDDDDEDDDGDDGQEDRKIVFPKNSKPKTPEEIQQLKDKLKQLIEDKRKNRQGKNYVPTEEAPKKDRSEEKKEKKKRKKQIKKKNKSAKEKKEEKKEGEGEKEEKKKISVINVIKKKSDAKPSLDVGNDIEFGTLKVDENGEIKPSYLIKQMEKKGKGKKSKLVKSLKLAEAEKKLIDELKEKEGGEEIVLQKSRERTLALVRGEKLRDDPTLLKKSLKNLKSQKKKSYTKIVKNKEAQKRSMEERQKRRDDNIAARNKIKSDYRKGVIKHKEMKKLTKEQRKRKSGFEGSKKKKKQKK